MRRFELPAAVLTVALIVATGLATHLLILCLFDPGAVAWRGEDATSYLREARALQAGIMPNLSRAIGYPLFLAATLPLGLTGVLAAQSLITIGSTVGTYFLLDRSKLAFWTAMLLASSPFLALFDFHTLSEALYVQLLWLGFLLLRRLRWAASGALIGAAAVVRDTLMLMPVFLLPAAFKDRRYLLTASLATVVIALAPHPNTRFGMNLWIGTWERDGGWYARGLEHPHFPANAFRLPNEKQEVDRAWLKDDTAMRNLALERIKSDTGATVLTWLERYPRLWIGTRSDSMSTRFTRQSAPWYGLKVILFALNLGVLALGLMGLARRGGLFAIPVLYVAVIYIPFHNCEPRYSLSALPFLYFYAAAACLGRDWKSIFVSAARRRNAGTNVVRA